MVRLSSYTVLSTRLKKGGYALLNGLSGAVDVVGEELNEILRKKMDSGESHDVFFQEGELPEAVVAQWTDRGYLTEDAHEAEKARLLVVSDALHTLQSQKRFIVFAPDTGCNYRCVYCFEKHLQSDAGAATAMTEEEADWAYQAIDQIGGGQFDRNISLFGGEPLNAANKDVVYKIVRMGAERGYMFQAVTNGHDLDAFKPLLGEGKINHIQVTLDGPKPLHDQRRIAMDGSSSYDKIMANLRMALTGTDVRVTIRVNIDDETLGGFGGLLEAFDNEGWMDLDIERFSVNAAIIYEQDNTGAISSARDLDSIADELRRQADRFDNVLIGSSQSNHGDFVLNSLTKGEPYSLRSGYCGAATGMYVFAPAGKVYCCWVSIGKECSEIGRYTAAGMTLDPVKSAEWFGRNAALIPECLECRYCLICAGGCPQYAQYNHGALDRPFCDGFQETYPWVLAEFVERYLSGEGV